MVVFVKIHYNFVCQDIILKQWFHNLLLKIELSAISIGIEKIIVKTAWVFESNSGDFWRFSSKKSFISTLAGLPGE